MKTWLKKHIANLRFLPLQFGQEFHPSDAHTKKGLLQKLYMRKQQPLLYFLVSLEEASCEPHR